MILAVMLLSCSLDLISERAHVDDNVVGGTAEILNQIDPPCDEESGDGGSESSQDVSLEEEVEKDSGDESDSVDASDSEPEQVETSDTSDKRVPRWKKEVDKRRATEKREEGDVPVESVVPSGVIPSESVDSEEIYEKISENLSKVLDEKGLNENTIRRIVREEIEKVLKERDSLRDKQADKKSFSGEGGESRVIIYRMDYCAPCDLMYNELVSAELPFQLYVGNYPSTFSDGSFVIKYPSAELVVGGKSVKKWEGRVPVNVILDACNEYANKRSK